MAELLWQNYKKQNSFLTYCHFYSDHYGRLVLAFLIFLVKSSPRYIIPIITADIINLLSENPNEFLHRLIVLFAVGFLLIAQNVPTHMLFVRMYSKVCREVEMKLRTSLCARLQHLSMHYHTSSKIGILQTKVLRDVENVEALSRTMLNTIPDIIVVMTTAIVTTLFRAPVFMLFYLVLIPTAVIIFQSIRKLMAQRNREFRQSVEEMTGKVNEMLRMIPVTRAHHLEDQEMISVHTKLERIRKTGLRIDKVDALFGSVTWAMMMFFDLFALCTAAFLRHKGIMDIGIGDVVLLSTYFGQISGSILTLLGVVPIFMKGMESVKSIGEVLECPDIEQNENKLVVNSTKGEFSFRHVSFLYPENSANALNDICLDVRPGENIAFVGPSGAGKSTIAQLVIGFIRPTEGQILLDGVDMNEIDLRTFRRFISVVTQETILFDGSIRDNIAYGIPDARDEDILRVVKLANLDGFVRSLPDGLNTRLQENGSRLSGGQRQRIAIARALIRDPQVLILDEATSALDVDSEAEIKESLEYLVKNRTTFTIAHRLSTIQKADRIVVLNEGRICEIGKHAELLAKNGNYAKMYAKFTKTV